MGQLCVSLVSCGQPRTQAPVLIADRRSLLWEAVSRVSVRHLEQHQLDGDWCSCAWGVQTMSWLWMLTFRYGMSSVNSSPKCTFL